MEAVNMLRESHRALMENDARRREELSGLKKRYRHDAKTFEHLNIQTLLASASSKIVEQGR